RWRRRPYDLGPARERAEISGDERFRLLRLKVSRDRDDGIAWRVVQLEEVLDVRFRCGREVRHAADDVPRVRVRRWIQRARDDLINQPIRLVIHPLPPFVLDDVALSVQLLDVEGVETK